jgi:hypothetical protein
MADKRYTVLKTKEGQVYIHEFGAIKDGRDYQYLFDCYENARRFAEHWKEHGEEEAVNRRREAIEATRKRRENEPRN